MLAIPLIELLILLVGLGMALLSRPQAGGLVNWLDKVLSNIPLVGGVLSVDQIVKLDRWVTHAIGKATEAVTARGTKWFAQLAHYQDTVGYWSLYWPVGLYHAVRHLVEHVIPRSITARTAPLTRRVDAAEAQAKAAAGVAHSLPKVARAHDQTKDVTVIERVAMPHAEEWDWLHRHWKALTAAVLGAAALAPAVAIPHPSSLPVPFGQTVKQIRRRLRKVEALLGVSAFAAVLAGTLGVGLNCLKPGGNLPRLARSVCRAPSWLIRFLVAGAIEAFIAADLCDFTKLLIVETEAVRPGLLELVDVENALVKCSGVNAQRVFALPPVSLPDLVGSVPLAA